MSEKAEPRFFWIASKRLSLTFWKNPLCGFLILRELQTTTTTISIIRSPTNHVVITHCRVWQA